MASGWDQTVAKNVIDAINGTASFTATTTPLKARLDTATGSSTSNGTELSTSGGYTAGGQTITFAAATYGSGAATANNNSVSWTNMPAATITAVEGWDSAGTPARKWWAGLSSSLTTNSGDTFTFAGSSLTSSVTA